MRNETDEQFRERMKAKGEKHRYFERDTKVADPIVAKTTRAKTPVPRKKATADRRESDMLRQRQVRAAFIGPRRPKQRPRLMPTECVNCKRPMRSQLDPPDGGATVIHSGKGWCRLCMKAGLRGTA